ncbi:MAG: helix-turn-helix domain-containing protein [Planctomycetaceae bacterium]
MSVGAQTMQRIRDELKLTQEHLAKFLDVPVRHVGEWESGTRPVEGPIVRLLELMDNDPEYFRVRFFGATPGCPDIRRPQRSHRS